MEGSVRGAVIKGRTPQSCNLETLRRLRRSTRPTCPAAPPRSE